MNITLLIIRYLATSLLSIFIFVSFLTFILASHFTGKLLNSSFYTNILEENDAYNRIYDEVLADPGIIRYIGRLPANLQRVSHQEVVALLQEIAPPRYLQEQIEGNVVRTVGYFDGQRAELNVYIDLTEPLEGIGPKLFSYINQQIDELEIVNVNPDLPLLEQLSQIQSISEEAMLALATGNPPRAVPSIETIPRQFRAAVFDEVSLSILNNAKIDPRVRQGIYAELPAIRDQFISGNTREFLKEAARAGLTPLVDRTLTQARQNLDEHDRLDIVAALSRSNPNVTEASVYADLENARVQIGKVKTWGRTVALLAAIAATVILVLIYLPSLTNMLRWPGLVLLFNGIMLFVAAKILETMLPDQLTPLIKDNLTQSPNIPPSAVALISDLSQSFNRELFTGMATPALLILIVGAVMLAASFLVVFLKPLSPRAR